MNKSCGGDGQRTPCREIKAHVPEPFWRIVLSYAVQGQRPCEFAWARGRLFDHAIAAVLYDLCLSADVATVTKVRTRLPIESQTRAAAVPGIKLPY